MKRLSAMVAALLCSPSLFAYDFASVAEAHIKPTYQSLQAATAELPAATQSYCADPNESNRQQLDERFQTAFLAWQGAQHIRFGPIQYLMREYRYALWPDKRGSIGKHLRRLLSSDQLQSADFKLAKQSVAVQGLSAFEYLFYSDSVGRNECQLLSLIATNLSEMSSDLVADWLIKQPAHIDYFVAPSSTNLVYESEQELASDLLGALYTELEMIVTQKLQRPLGESLEDARGERAEGWRSGTSLDAIAANLRASETLYQTLFAPELAESPLQQRISADFATANQLLAEITMPLDEAVTDAEQRSKVVALQRHLSALKGVIGRDMATQLNLTLGFNSLDGD